ncbi:MAG: metal-dependent hydrolase [Synergistaceae bacterium]|nr:metal-dependent hydrolase [Synergistaceae bacterium]
MNIQYLGHACFLITSNKITPKTTSGAASDHYSLLIDPFLNGNPAAKARAEDVTATHIFVTHGHDDHLGDAVSIATRCASTVYATVETGGRFPQTVKVEVGQIGGFIRSDFGGVKFTAAAHGSNVPGGLACGFLIELEGKKIYHAGDTGLIIDMMLLAEENVDVALLPIGDRFTMGPRDAMRAVGFIKPKRVVPMHYNTWPIIEQNPELFKKEAEAVTGVPVSVLAVGEELQC